MISRRKSTFGILLKIKLKIFTTTVEINKLQLGFRDF